MSSYSLKEEGIGERNTESEKNIPNSILSLPSIPEPGWNAASQSRQNYILRINRKTKTSFVKEQDMELPIDSDDHLEDLGLAKQLYSAIATRGRVEGATMEIWGNSSSCDPQR